MPRKSALSLTIIILFVVVTALQASPKLTVDGVASKLSCYCGTCPHLVVTDCGCSTADQIKLDIAQKISTGMSEDQIIQSYVAQYGQTVLSAPPKSGFNLAAWGLPFVGFILGGAILMVFLKRQQKISRPTSTGSNSLPLTGITLSDEQDRYRELLQQELDSRK